LRDSDLLDLPDVKVTLLDQTGDEATVLGEYTLSASLANLASRHRGRGVARTTGDPCATCELVAHWDLVEQTLGSAIISGELSARGRDVEIPQALGAALHGAGFAINKLDVAWHIAEGRGIGRAAVDLSGITLPSGAVDAVRADVAIGATAGSAVWGRMDTFTVESVSQQLSLAGTSFAADLPRSLIDFVVAPIDAAVLAQLVRAGGANVEALTRWIDALTPHGRIDGLVARLDYSARTAAAVARLEDGAIDHYKGVPTVRGGRATIAAFEHGAELDLVPGPATVGMLDLFGEVSELESLSGRVFIWMGSGYLGVKSMDLDAKLGPSVMGGWSAIAHRNDPEEQRVSSNVGLRDMDAAVAKRYVPIKLPAGVVRFLEQGIVGGHLDELALAYHGHTRAIEELPMRRLEMHVTMHDGAIRYHPDWPIASGLVGDLDVTFDQTSGRIVSGQMLGLALDSGSFVYDKGRDCIEVHGTAHGDATQALEFFRASPLATWMPQVDPSWTAKGPVSFVAALNVPMREGGTPLAVTLDSKLDGVDLDMANWRLPIGGLRGDVHYTHPLVVS